MIEQPERIQSWRTATPESVGDADPASQIDDIAAWCGPLRDRTLLDYGAGTGRIALPLTALGATVIAADPNPDFLRPLNRRGIPTLLLGGRLRDRLPRVDGGYSSNVFIHFRWAYAARALIHLASAVRPGGAVLVQMPVYDEAREGASWLDVSTWTAPMLDAAADAAGLRVVEAHTNPGAFAWDRIGPNHGRFQVMVRR